MPPARLATPEMIDVHTQPHTSRYHLAWETAERADVANSGTAELLAAQEVEALHLAAAADYDPGTRELIELRAGTRLRLVKEELARREARYAADPSLLEYQDPNYQAWADLAQLVGERADPVPWLQAAGYYLEQTGGGEWHGPCPQCGGRDRFVVWDTASGRRPGFWCRRRCGFQGDAIDAYQLAMPLESFHKAVRVLAAPLGLQTPDWGCARPHIDLGEVRPLVDLGEISHDD